MNDELEATLEWLKTCGANDYIFETGNSKILLDYITNLQQENERLKKDNKILKQNNINEVLRNDFDMCVKDLKKANKKIEKLEDYKSRIEKAIEKAIEYIEHNTFQDSDDGWIFTFYKGKEILLDILNDRSDE